MLFHRLISIERQVKTYHSSKHAGPKHGERELLPSNIGVRVIQEPVVNRHDQRDVTKEGNSKGD